MKKKITIAGMVLIILMALVVPGLAEEDNSNGSEDPYIFVTEWGSKGYDDGQFGALAILSGSTYVITDETIEDLKNIINKEYLETLISLKNKEIDNGTEFYYTLEKLGLNSSDICIVAKAAALKKVITEPCGPLFIAVDKFNNIYVSDRDKAQIQKFDSEGNFLTKWGRCGSGKGQFSSLSGVAVDSECYVYALDVGNNRIQKFDSNGNFILQWGGIYPTSPGYFASITGIAISPDNYIYVNNKGTNLQKFDVNGNFIKEWLPPWDPSSSGYKPKFVRSMAIDTENNFFILTYGYHPDNVTHNIVMYPYIRKMNLTKCSKIWGEEIFGGEKYNAITNFTLDSKGNIFVINKQDNCIYKVAPDGNLLAEWGSYGSAPGQFNNPESIAVDSEGNVYVMDTGNYRIQKFAPNPDYKENN